jgi:short-subunit dehydrogenase
LELVAQKAKEINPNITAEVVPSDLSKIRGDEAKDLLSRHRYSIVVNNAGRMNRGKFLE